MNIPSFDPERNYLIYITDILESIERIEKYCDGYSEEKFSQDIQTQDSVIRRFQIIGEAAGRIPQEIRKFHMDIPWEKIVAFRNLIIHDYASVDFGKVWRVIKQELPILKPQLVRVEKYLQNKSKK